MANLTLNNTDNITKVSSMSMGKAVGVSHCPGDSSGGPDLPRGPLKEGLGAFPLANLANLARNSSVDGLQVSSMALWKVVAASKGLQRPGKAPGGSFLKLNQRNSPRKTTFML